MKKIELVDIYYRQNADVKEYLDIYFNTTVGVLKNNITSLDIVLIDTFYSSNRLVEMDTMKEKYGNLFIEEARKTYDNDMYLLISNKWILAIEYVLNSTSEHSFQEFRFIEDINASNKDQLIFFESLEKVKLPNSI